MAQRMYVGYFTVVRLDNDTHNFNTITHPCYLEAQTQEEAQQKIRVHSEEGYPESAGWTARVVQAEELNPILARRGYTLTQPDITRRPRPQDSNAWKSD